LGLVFAFITGLVCGVLVTRAVVMHSLRPSRILRLSSAPVERVHRVSRSRPLV